MYHNNKMLLAEHGPQRSSEDYAPTDQATLAALEFQKQCRKGDDNLGSANQAFELMVELATPHLFPVAVSLTHSDPDAAHDLVQQTHLKAFRALSECKFRGDSSVISWMTRILINCACDHNNRHIDEPVDPLVITTMPVIDAGTSVEDTVVGNISAEQIIDDINIRELNDRERKIIYFLIKGTRYAEIALAIGLSVGATKVAVHRLRTKLETTKDAPD